MSPKRPAYGATRMAWAWRSATTTMTAGRTSTSRTSAGTSCTTTTATARSPTSPKRPAWRAGGWSSSACLRGLRPGRLARPHCLALSSSGIFTTIRWCGPSRADRAYCHPEEFKPVTHLCTTTTATARSPTFPREAGLGNRPATVWASSFNDFDLDGWPDIIVANDKFRSNSSAIRATASSKRSRSTLASPIDEDGAHVLRHGRGFQGLQ